ncbi:hypothetical protein RRG08_052219 [Elysia crispata]|uniref:Uncharacterized protein n=1 Tax=Elysia crispata TaxID=231223 RepID=A0AAE1E7J2_9GAST|nr:hypothetical protein RRG08_052219 [Elysia crispata]
MVESGRGGALHLPGGLTVHLTITELDFKKDSSPDHKTSRAVLLHVTGSADARQQRRGADPEATLSHASFCRHQTWAANQRSSASLCD